LNLFSAVSVGDSLQNGLDSFFGFLPKLLGFLIVLVIGWLIARVVKTIVTKGLEKVGLDKALHSGTTGQYVDRVAPDTSRRR
jgi:Conserved TM helix